MNPMICAGYAVCVATLPDVFELAADGHAHAKTFAVPHDLEHDVERCAGSCPTGAIVVVND